MIDFEHLSPDTLLIVPSGHLSVADMGLIDGLLRDTLGGDADGRLNILLDLRGLCDVSAAAPSPERTAEALIGPYLPRIKRLAVISDSEWATVMLRIAARVLPEADLRAFDGEDRDRARDFVLGQLPQGESDKTPALRLLDSGHPDLLAYEIDGVLTQDDAERVLGVLEHALDRDRPVSLLVRITRYGGFDPSMLLSGPLWTMKLAAIRNLHRYAIVGAEPWMQSVVQFANPVTPVDMRLFGRDAEDEARAWVREGLTDPS